MVLGQSLSCNMQGFPAKTHKWFCCFVVSWTPFAFSTFAFFARTLLHSNQHVAPLLRFVPE